MAKWRYILKNFADDKYYYVECVDSAPTHLVFEVDSEWVKAGIFPSQFLDSRDLEGWGFELLLVPPPNQTEH